MTEATATDRETGQFILSRWLGSKKFRTNSVKLLAYVVVTAGAVVLLIPFFWMLSTSVKPLAQAFAHPPVWIPIPPQWGNYIEAWNALPFNRFFLNSLFITTFGMAAEILSCAIVAYGFARFRFPGRNALFIILLSTMMLPWVVRLIPGFMIWRTFKLVNTFDPLVVGALFAWGPINVFIIRQFMMGIPLEIEEAARIDGASEIQIFFRVIIPNIRGTLLTITTTILIMVLKVFDIVFVMTSGQFGTQVIANSMFNQMFTFRQFGRASALAVILLIGVIPVMIYNVRNLRESRS